MSNSKIKKLLKVISKKHELIIIDIDTSGIFNREIFEQDIELQDIETGILYSDNLDYSSGLYNVMYRYFGPLTNSSQSIDNERNIAIKYNIYLPYINKLTNISRINIYDLINKGMKFIDEDNMILNIMIVILLLKVPISVI